ncbi:glycoside hydrolase family 44 protein [Paenibacillus flagellatus]|nr:glycoside hydrolase family 44 protein [Paenibacillus flagellatus]
MPSLPTLRKPGRLLRLATAAALLLGSIGFPGTQHHARAEARIEASAEATPSIVEAGSSANVDITVTSSETTSVMIDLELFDSSLNRVKQIVVDNVAVTAGQPATVPFRWDVPATLAPGRYIVSFGVFGAGWSARINEWFAAAASITVTGGAQSPVLASSAAVSPAGAAYGDTIVVDAAVTVAADTEAVTELRLIGPDGAEALTRSFAGTLRAAEPNRFRTEWTVPEGAAAGSYAVGVDVYSPDRLGTYHQNREAARFSVTPTTGQPLPAPEHVQAVPFPTAVDLSWSAVPGATGYEVEADGVAAPAGGATETAYRHEGLAPDTEHAYRVRAVGIGGAPGAWSEPVQVRTKPDSGENPASAVKVAVKTGTDASTPMLGPNFRIVNASRSPIALSDVKVRYYFTIDGEEKPLSIGFWSSVPDQSRNVSASFVKMPTPAADADRYLEIGFADGAGTLAPGGDVVINTWINKSDWSNFDQTNDYSFERSTDLSDSLKTTAYVSGHLSWGQEPVLLDLPPFPSRIAAVPADTSVALTWEPVAGATGYDVMADGSIVGPLSEASFTQQWLAPGTRHTYYVRTRSGERTGVWSPAVTVKTTGLPNIPAPANIKSQRTDTSIALTWSAPDAEITGYDIEVDGSVLDAGTSTSYTHEGLEPGSRHTYRIRAKQDAVPGTWSALLSLNTTYTPTGTFDVDIEVDPSADRQPISPYIYGTNDDLSGVDRWTARRMGGNRLTTYNWENNASNSGDDEAFHSDRYVAHYFGGVPWSETGDEPGVGVTGFHERSLAQGAYTLTTLQTAGYVAKDVDGYVTQAETAPSSRWVEVKPAKNAPFSLTPDLTDDAVYMDELVNLLVSRFGNASTATGVRGYEIDNEPGIWRKTHAYMHPQPAGAAEVLNKGIALAKAVKNVDPHAELFGPAAFGFDDMYNMFLASDWPALKANYGWYLDYYLDRFRAASEQENRRLLDALDIHWYPETTGGGIRIQYQAGNDNPETNKARLQAPRQLWDTSYTEDTWFFKGDYASFFPLIPSLQRSIDTYNPGTKIAFTEYNYGAEHNIFGGIAQADVLGIYGKFNVYMANFWRMTDATLGSAYVSAAFKLYTDYDGAGSKFGDTKVRAETSDIENSSVYGSVYKDDDDKLHLIVLNKNTDFDMNAIVNIAGDTAYKSARVWAFDASGPAITERQPVARIENNKLVYTVPKLTACHIVLSAEPQ